jgi:hypothetical protein
MFKYVMRNYLIPIVFIPSGAYAAGNEIYSLYVWQLFSVAMVVGLFMAGISTKNHRWIFLVIYIVTAGVSYYLTSGLVYRENVLLVNFLCAGLPLLLGGTGLLVALRAIKT